jgi:hypothetical protein
LIALLLSLGLWAAHAGPAAAQAEAASAAEIALAERYAPVVKLQERPGDGDCDEGEPYEPIDVDAIMGNDEVLLRGPWDRTNMVAIAPSAQRLGAGLWGYHLDFPGDPLRPGCTYAEWAERITAGYPATTYARVNTEDGKPGLLALQYWFYYVFNDWNNTHEGDWEMIQIIFPADSAEEALRTAPTEVGYSQHSSAERALWGDDKLELQGGTHPVVYPAAGSHANFYSNDIFLMRSEAEGVGCDDAGGDTRTITPAVATVPTAPADHLPAYPWLGYDGRWGEQQASVFNGPTGPNEKLSWTQPITWSQQFWRDDTFTVPSGGGLIGTSATDFFCTAVGTGSEILRRAKANPLPFVIALAALAALFVWGFSRTTWTPTSPVQLRRRRAWGQLLTTALRMMHRHPRTFFGIGVLFLPLGALIAVVQWLLFNLTSLELLLDEAGEQNAFVAWVALVIGLFFGLFGLTLVHAATARAAVGIAAGEHVRALDAYRSVLPRWRELVLALLVALGVQTVLQSTLVLVPVAIFFLVRWSLFAVAVGVEGHPRPGPLRRSGALSSGNWWRIAAVVIGITGTALFLGPAIGVLALIGTGATFAVVNLISAVVYMFAMPIAALTTTYLYFDLVEREQEAHATANATAAGPDDGTLAASG